jgi:K+-transporting ATPase KdpF subunit
LHSHSATRPGANAFAGAAAMIETVIMLAICALLLVYLVYAMLRPEKF